MHLQTEPLKQLVYTSVSRTAPEEIVTSDFVAKIQARNHSFGITGSLAWYENKFMQIIEGPASAVNRLFAEILQDPRHKEIALISERIVHQREFPNWDMSVVSLTDKAFCASFAPKEYRARGSRILDAFRRGLWQ